jgi:hypothetical protein
MRHHMPVNSADPIVATAAMRDNRILVSQDKDFGHQRFMAPRFASLNRLALVGAGPTLSSAVKQYMHLIELHWSHKSRKGARLTIHVKADEVRFRD